MTTTMIVMITLVLGAGAQPGPIRPVAHAAATCADYSNQAAAQQPPIRATPTATGSTALSPLAEPA
jgi:ABC-type phosphate transport system substrate-binding protein